MAKIFKKISFKEAGDKGVSLSYVNYDENGPKDITSKECKSVPHKDFTAALQKFCYHLLFLTEMVDETKYSKYPDIIPDNYRVTGVSISGEGEKEGVVITGYKTLSTGKGFVFNTPQLKLDGSEYTFLKELNADLQTLRKEANEYISGKYGVVQGDLFEEQKELEEATG